MKPGLDLCLILYIFFYMKFCLEVFNTASKCWQVFKWSPVKLKVSNDHYSNHVMDQNRIFADMVVVGVV